MNWNALVSAETLHAALGAQDLVLVDCRASLADAEAGPRDWAAAHLPGARHAHLERDLSDHARPATEGRHPLPSSANFRSLLASLDVRPEAQVVAYDYAEGALAAARFWWLLRLIGHRRVAVLDGGYARWQALGLPLETVPPPPGQGHYEGEFDCEARLTTAAIEANLATGRLRLLDARAPERFRGEVEPLDPVAGHIPGARNRPFADNLEAGRFKPAARLRAEFEALLEGAAPTQAVLYCGSGVTACHNLLAMEAAGLAGARLYPPSWSGWVADRAHPVATGPA